MNLRMHDKKYMLILLITAALIIAAAVVFFTISRKARTGTMDEQIMDTQPGDVRSIANGELIGVFADKEEAEAAAKLYNIRLKSFDGRVAVFEADTSADIQKLIEDGKAKGWPELSINFRRELY